MSDLVRIVEDAAPPATAVRQVQGTE
jgi:hypothetical protein